MTQPWQQDSVIIYSRLLGESYARWMMEALLAGISINHSEYARALYEAPFPLVSHGTQVDPIFRYANLAAQALWETDWERFTQMPSRLSAEPVSDIQGERNALLKRAMEKGFVSDYSGIRISTTGKRFEIRDTVLWNVVDAQGIRHGQAACIATWAAV